MILFLHHLYMILFLHNLYMILFLHHHTWLMFCTTRNNLRDNYLNIVFSLYPSLSLSLSLSLALNKKNNNLLLTKFIKLLNLCFITKYNNKIKQYPNIVTKCPWPSHITIPISQAQTDITCLWISCVFSRWMVHKFCHIHWGAFFI